MKSYQVSFFGESQRLAALSRLNDPLEKLKSILNLRCFSTFWHMPCECGAEKLCWAQAFGCDLMFKALIIQRVFNLSDEQLEYQITDRLSFTRFLGLHIGETIIDHSSFRRFWDALAEKGLERELFERFSTNLEADGVFAKAGSIIDATIVEVPRQRNSWEVNARIKAGEVPAEWDDAKRVHKDTDARWVKTIGVNYFGYKDHIKTDAGTSLITDYRVTVASTHDSVVLKELLSEADAEKPLHADGTYTGEQIEGMLKELNIENQVCEKGRRGAPLSKPSDGTTARSRKSAPCLSIYGELHEWNLPKVHRTQKGQLSDRIGQPDLQYLPLRATGSPESSSMCLTHEKTIANA